MTTKFNGVSYIVQRAAESLYSRKGRRRSPSSSNIISATRSFPQRREESWTESVRRRERAVIWVPHRKASPAGRRSTRFWRGECCHHTRQRVRLEGRRLFPHQRLQQPCQRRGSRPPVAGIEVVNQKFEIENRSRTLLRVLFYFVLLGVVAVGLCIRHALVENAQAGVIGLPRVEIAKTTPDIDSCRRSAPYRARPLRSLASRPAAGT